MMSSAHCYQKADLCETFGAEYGEPTRSHWLSMAAEWRCLGADGSPQATTARLMRQARVSA